MKRRSTRGLADAKLLFGFADSPQDIERRFSTTRNGSVRQGALVTDQTFEARPHVNCSTGRTPVAGLYVGGAGFILASQVLWPVVTTSLR
jgi:hypothetical protein